MNFFGLGIGLLVFGLVFWLVTRLLLRVSPRLQPVSQTYPSLTEGTQPHHTDAVITVEPGGRVINLNPRTRHIFHLSEQEIPNLEVLSRQIRPSEPFLSLCVSEGQARFSMEGKAYEATSYLVTDRTQPAMMITMRAVEDSPALTMEPGGANTQNLQRLTELTQAIASSLELEATISAVLENVGKLIPADSLMITLWDKESEWLTPYRMLGTAGVERRLESPAIHYRAGEGYSGTLAQTRTPLLISDTAQPQAVQLKVDRNAYSLKSYLGVPLLLGKDFIGTLEMGSLTENTFKKDDLDFIQLIAGQAAIALHNASMYREERRRTQELSSLAQLSQNLGVVRDPANVFERLVQSIQPLVPVEILGFLIFNESTRMLEAKVPYYGLPSQFIEVYSTPVPAGSPVEHMLLDQDVVMSENAAEDDNWVMLGLSHIAQAASLRDTVLVPLSSSGRAIGYLQASNHIDGSTTFTQDELRLLFIVANQAASIIENTNLVHQSRLRAQRAEALRRIASLASSAANLDEILKYSMQELARLLHADVGLVFLLNQNRTELLLHNPSVYNEGDEKETESLALRVDDAQFHFTVTGNQHAVKIEKVADERTLVPYYRQLAADWNISSAVVVPLVVRDQGIGELWIASKKDHSFEQGDLQPVVTAAGTLAGVVEQSTLTQQTDESLRRRVEQLTALSRITRELSTTLDVASLMKLVYEDALRLTGAECGSVLLFDPHSAAQKEHRVHYHVGDTPREKLSSLENDTLLQGEILNIPDTSKVENGLFHEGVQSALLVPIVYQGQAAGLMLLHSQRSDHFDQTAVDIIQSLAAQTAVALGNAVLYENQLRRGELLKRELDTLGRLFHVTQQMQSGDGIENSLTSIAKSIQEVTPFSGVVISVVDQETRQLKTLVSAGLSPEIFNDLRNHAEPWESVLALLQPEFKTGSSYFIPADKAPVTPEDMYSVAMLPQQESDDSSLWNADDFLLAPLYNGDGSPLGLISLDMPSDGKRPDRVTLDALDLFAAQASLMMEVFSTRVELETRLELAARGEEGAAQSASNKLAADIIQRQINRLQTGLDIAENATQQETPEKVLQVLGEQLIEQLGFEAVVVGETGPAGPRLARVIGTLPASANLESMLGQRNPLRQVLIDQQVMLVADVNTSDVWNHSSLITSLGGNSFIAFPVNMREDQVAGILAVSKSIQSEYTEEDRQVIDRLARQVSARLQNLNLLSETRRHLEEVDLLLQFSRTLGSLDPNEILKSLIQSAREVLPSIQAAWAGLVDESDGNLRPVAAWGFADADSLLKIRYGTNANGNLHGLTLPAQVAVEGNTRRIAEVNFVRDYALPSDDLLLYRAAVNGRLPVSEMLVPIRLSGKALGVLVLENFNIPAAFSAEDEALATSLTQQSALAIENARLFRDAEQRAAQLQALTQVGGAITANLESSGLIASLPDLLKEVIPFDTATIWLRKENELTVAVAQGFDDSERRMGITAAVEDSALFQEMVRTGQALNIPNVRVDERFPSLVTPELFSWLGLPLLAKSEVVGLIALEKREVGFYTPTHIQAATTFASQAAVALENARLFEESNQRASELNQRSERLALLNRFSGEVGSTLDVDVVIKLTSQQLQQALDLTRVAAVLVDEQGQFVLTSEVPSAKDVLPRILPDAPLLRRLHETEGIFSTSNVSGEADLAPLMPVYFESRGVRSLLVIPLLSGANFLGWFLLESSQVYRFSVPEIELARTISNQAAIAIQNARLFAETRRLTADLERRVEERTAELSHEHRNSQTLLRIITELSTSLDMNQVLVRAMNVLMESTFVEQGMILLAQTPTVYKVGKDLVTIDPDDKDQPEKLISKWVMRQREPALVDDIHTDARWNFKGHEFQYTSLLGVPLIIGEDVLGTLLLFHHQPAFFLLEQINLFEASARQMAISLNNAELFNLIRDQAERLGGLLREQQIEASRSRSILESVADGVLVTDSGNHISLINPSAEHILNMKAGQVVGQSVDQLTGLFGRASRSWAQTIRKWTQDPNAYQSVEPFAERVDLDNGTIVSIQMAPVYWRAQFLGTVSTFRDITHEVQVERLKSEFLANVSHELRTPMTSIKGYVEIMLMGAAGALSDQQHHFLDIIKENTQRLGVLVNDLLDISRMEAGRVHLTFTKLDLAEIARDVVEDNMRRSQEENKPITFRVQAPKDLPTAMGDAERVRQILGNLASNGYNYTPADGTVVISLKQVKDEIQVDVKDNGIGIAPEVKHRIFDRFYRGEDPLVLATAGTGLGLAVSKTLVEMHHGRIWFVSNGVPGDGSTFSFTLPLVQPEE